MAPGGLWDAIALRLIMQLILNCMQHSGAWQRQPPRCKRLSPSTMFTLPRPLRHTLRHLLAGALIAYALWFRGVARLPTVAVASLGLLSPLTAVMLGWVLLSQSMTGSALAGLVVVLASVLAVQWTAARRG